MANPIFIPLEFAKNGIKNVIQKVRQSGQDIQDMTWNDGTPSATMTRLEDGGLPPKGQDFNGALYAISSHTVFQQNGNRYKWSQDVIDEFGGYPMDAIIQSDDGSCEYKSIVSPNTVNPNNGLQNSWVIYTGQGSIPVATSTTTGATRVLNVLNSTDVGSALSAAQGKVLKDTIDSISNPVKKFCRISTAFNNPVFLKNSGFSSVTRISGGFYRFTFSSAAPDSNYLVMTTGSWNGAAAASIDLDESFTQTATQFQIRCTYGGDNTQGAFDPAFINIAIVY